MNKLQNQLPLANRERYSTYRNGEVETLTFETDDYHLCYGVDSSGEIFDFCFIGNKIVTIEGMLNDKELEKAQRVIDSL